MRIGGGILEAVLAAILVTSTGCGSRRAPDSPTSPEIPTGSTMEGAAGMTSIATAGAAGQPSLAELTDYPDPSKLLESYETGGNGEHAQPGKPSRSGLSLEVMERGPDEPWLVHVVNRGDRPAEFVADTRLLWFEVKLPVPEQPKKKTTKPAQPKPAICKLPEPMAPGSQPEPRLVVHLMPGEGVADRFDPRLYCFAAGSQRLLVPGAEITPHFGYPEAPPKKRWKKGKLVEEPSLQKPPFVARESLESSEAKRGPSNAPEENRATPKAAARLTSAAVSGADKQLEGAPMVLRSEYATWTHQGASARGSDDTDPDAPPPGPLVLRLVQGSDARAEHDATVDVALINQSPLPTYVYFRREMLYFEVAGPMGITRCPSRIEDRTPERSSFLHLTRKAQRRYSCRMAELCPNGTFGVPGLYLVYARFDAAYSGQEQGIEAFVGPVYSEAPATVRIRTAELPLIQKRPMMRTNEAEKTSLVTPEVP